MSHHRHFMKDLRPDFPYNKPDFEVPVEVVQEFFTNDWRVRVKNSNLRPPAALRGTFTTKALADAAVKRWYDANPNRAETQWKWDCHVEFRRLAKCWWERAKRTPYTPSIVCYRRWIKMFKEQYPDFDVPPTVHGRFVIWPAP